MTTDAERARHLSDIAAAGLGQAAFSLGAAMEQIEAVDRSLDTMGHAAGMLNHHALGLALADDQEDRWRRLNAAREDATALDDRLRSTQRVLAGEPLASDGVDLSADDHLRRGAAGIEAAEQAPHARACGNLRRGAAGIEAAEQALHELQWVDGHDARATEGLADRASVLRAA